MGQFGFFDADKRLAALSAKGDPLEAIAALVPWESFRADIEAVVLTPEDAKQEQRRPQADRCDRDVPHADACSRCTISPMSRSSIRCATVCRLRGFSGSASKDRIPDGTTLWLFREKLAKAGLIDRRYLNASASISRPRAISRAAARWSTRRSCRCRSSATRDEENEAVKAGQTPEDWARKPAKNRQKDKDARWTKKHGKKLLWLQEPRQRGRPAQADPATTT